MKPTLEELKAASARVQKVLDDGAEAELRAIPGVEHVAVGVKQRKHALTDVLGIRVYVRKKRPESEIPPAERIPRVIGGEPTDVNEVRPFRFSIDTRRHRPLKGGIMISNQIIGLNQSGTGRVMKSGTFGCTATLTRDRKPVLLGNWHVLMANGARPGEPIYQPAPLQIPKIPLDQLPVRRVGRKDDIIAHIVDSAITTKVDAAIARLDVSSCCRCCGLDFRNEIVGLSVGGTPPSNKILGLRAAVANEKVYKVGIATGRTVGRVVTAATAQIDGRTAGVDHSFTGQIEIESDDPNDVFSDDGDSGAVIIGEDGFIVGLLFGATGFPDFHTYANHIADVCSALKITINLSRPGTTAGPRIAVPPATFTHTSSRSGAELYAAARSKVLAEPAGVWLWALAEEHREEIVSLVTTRRPVTVAWHRAGGPACFADALNTLRAGGERLPAPPNGGSLEAALARVGDALETHGSPELRAAIGQYRAALLGAVRGSSTLGDVLEKLRGAIPELPFDSLDEKVRA